MTMSVHFTCICEILKSWGANPIDLADFSGDVMIHECTYIFVWARNDKNNEAILGNLFFSFQQWKEVILIIP